MRCVYINLASQTDRRRALTANFEAHGGTGWTLERLEATSADQAEAVGLPGAANAREKACFLSHRRVLAENAAATAPFMVLEDDAEFGPRSCFAIDHVVSNLAPDAWDVLFTDIAVADVGAWADVVRIRRRHFAKAGELRLLDLGDVKFAGTTAYVVNPTSVGKLSALLASLGRLDLPLDLYFRNLIHRGAIKGLVTIPFLTTLSDLASHSSIQQNPDGSAVPLLDLFRRMVWVDRDLAKQAPAIQALRSAYVDRESELFATLFGAMISDKVQW